MPHTYTYKHQLNLIILTMVAAVFWSACGTHREGTDWVQRYLKNYTSGSNGVFILVNEGKPVYAGIQKVEIAIPKDGNNDVSRVDVNRLMVKTTPPNPLELAQLPTCQRELAVKQVEADRTNLGMPFYANVGLLAEGQWKLTIIAELANSERIVDEFEVEVLPKPLPDSEPAVDFDLDSVLGQKISLSEFQGQPVLLNFWATWCGPCRQEMPILDEIYQKYKSQGLVVLGVNVEESHDAVSDFLREYPVTYPILFDPTGTVNQAYSVRGLPHNIFIRPSGCILSRRSGLFWGEPDVIELVNTSEHW